MKYQTYTKEQIEHVKNLFENGKNQSEISRLTGVPRGTLKYWIKPCYIRSTDNPRNSYEPIQNPLEYLSSSDMRKAYSFVLGIYLCDGYISRYKTYRAPSIRFFNDAKYPKNTREWADNLQIILPENSINIYSSCKFKCDIVLGYSKKLLDLFPQYGDGPKYKRKLILMAWQKQILAEFPREFIRACFQSDGCIYQQKIGSRLYHRYSFSNMSKDITEFFLFCLKQVGIEKEIYQHPSKGIYVIQNFSKEAVGVLQTILDKKE